MFHKSALGTCGEHLTSDLDGYVPEATDTDPFAFRVDHGTERTHDDAGNLTEYGEWYAEESYPAWRAESAKATGAASANVADWQTA